MHLQLRNLLTTNSSAVADKLRDALYYWHYTIKDKKNYRKFPNFYIANVHLELKLFPWKIDIHRQYVTLDFCVVDSFINAVSAVFLRIKGHSLSSIMVPVPVDTSYTISY